MALVEDSLRPIMPQPSHNNTTPHSYHFPDPSNANDDGLLAIGGDLHPERVFSAHCQGIFPWFNAEQPILWWSPATRAVIPCAKVHISRSLRRFWRKQDIQLTFDHDFLQVMEYCRSVHGESWINDDMINAYVALHSQGRAHSIEVWQDDLLLGGLYGVALNRVFCAESMFSLSANASKMALVSMCLSLAKQGITTLDCQFMSQHLAQMGAVTLPRDDYLSLLGGNADRLCGSWRTLTPPHQL